MSHKKLSEEDQQRVDEYLSAAIHTVERKPFRPLLLLAVLAAVITCFTLASLYVAKTVGAI